MSETLICRSRGKLSADEKEEKIHRIIIIISLHFPNRELSKDDSNGDDDARKQQGASKHDVDGSEIFICKCNFAFLQSFFNYSKSLCLKNVF